MHNGDFPEGACVLRAKIDMAANNINMRDPTMYRIIHSPHHRTGNKWCIYPMYDFAHGQSDSMEGVTHSLCDLAYEDHRPLYNWFIDQLGIFKTRQIEFARLNVTYTILSKRFLKQLGRGWICAWLGRSAYAHFMRYAPSRLPGNGNPQFHRPGRCSEKRESYRYWFAWNSMYAIY